MNTIQANSFLKVVKRLHANQKADLDKAIQSIITDPHMGDLKTADLAGVRVYKFRMAKQPVLLAYMHDEDNDTLILLALGSHENFYRDLKQ